ETLLAYDYNGNTTRECRDHGDPTCQVDHDHLRELSWNEENRLTSVVEGGGRHVTSFLYDAAGQRVVKQGRGGDSITIGQFFNLKGKIAATKHVFAGETRLASKLLPPPGWVQGLVPVPTAPTTTATTLPGCDPSTDSPNKCPPPGAPPVAYGVDTTTVRPETYYYHADHLGSTSWVTDQNGKVHEHVEYYPYGEVWWEPKYDRDGAGAKGQRFLFTSKELDEETGLYYFGARYLDPVTVRWLSVDPEIQNQRFLTSTTRALDVYLTMFGNPLRFVDPSGRQPALPPGALPPSKASDVKVPTFVESRKPGKTPPKSWPALPEDAGGKKPTWNPGGFWDGKGGRKLTWDDRSHGAGEDRGNGPQGGHWDDEGSNNRWDENGRLLPGSPDLSRATALKAAGAAAGTVGAGYLIYRGVRMIPSLVVWPTIPANLAIP
ncbi:MAG: RHS repeat-associated core domain-containing protein, partial [Anaeromyxobacteraceae bacterium]